MGAVDDFINSYDDEKKEWLATFVSFMRGNFPAVEETMAYRIPTYKFNKCYIAFSVAKDHFSFHTLDFAMIEELKGLLPRARFGKGCAKVRYDDKAAVPILFEACRKIVARKMGN